MQKKLYLLLLCACIVNALTAQVGVGTTTPNSTLDVRGSLAAGYRAFTTATTASANDHLLVFTGTVAATLTLPDAVPCAGRMYWVKNVTTSPLTIATTAAQTIDGLPNWTIAAANKTVKLVSNGANWLVTAEMVPGSSATAWVPGGNTFATVQTLGTTSNNDLPFIANGVEKMRLHTDGKLEVGTSTSTSTTAILTRSATTPANDFDEAGYSNFNGGVIQSTYPGGLTGQVLNIAATGANSGNWPSDIAFHTRNNGGTNATQKLRLFNNGRLELGTNTTPAGPAILTRAATSPNNNFTPVTYADYNGGVIQSTYPGSTTGQNLNIAATGANSGNWPSNIVFFTRNNGGTNATQKMRLWDNGRLELGSVTGTNGTAFTIRSATTVSTFPTATYGDLNGGVIQSTYPGGFVGQILNISATGANSGNWPSNIAFWTRINGGTNSVERMRITDDGFVGIGCTSPNYRLQVVGDIAASGGTLRAASAVISTSISACSDIRYKKNIKALDNALGNVMKLQGVSYNWKTDEYPDNYFTDKHQLGVIAQELEKVYPELVETDAKGYKTVDYSKMTPVLLEAIKEQQRQIAAQQAQIDALRNDVAEIKKAMAGAKK